MKAEWFPRSGGTGIAAVAGVAALCCGVLAGAAGPGRAAVTAAQAASPGANRPAGFWKGTDSWPITIGRKVPYQEPAIGGDYGGYIGMAGSWAWWEGCHGKIAWSATNSAQANTNYRRYHLGIGTGVYWFMGGPGVDANYNGTIAEAYSFGQNQARKTLYELGHMKISLTYPVIFADIELPGIPPAPDNGWNSVYRKPCTGKVVQSHVSADLDRAEFNGYAAYLTSHSSDKVGVYSDPKVWADIFGTGADSLIPNTYEWTYSGYTSSLAHRPDGWCLHGTKTCAAFFGGQKYSSRYALMWQWSGGGGTWNGYGDFDQIDAARTP